MTPRTVRGVVVALAMCAALASSVHAQAFNLDFGYSAGVPFPAYGAASGQDGYWDVQATVSHTLTDITGTPTSVTNFSTGTNFIFSFAHPGTSGDDEKLMDDGVGGASIYTVSGLADGDYEIYTYAWAPDNSSFVTDVSVDHSGDPRQVVGGPWPGGHVLGVTYARHFVTIEGGADLVVRTKGAMSFATTNGMQIVPCEGRSTYCTAKTGLACGTPSIGWTGTPRSTQPSGFVVTAQPALAQRAAMLLYTSGGRGNLPFPPGGHVLCVSPAPLQRAGPASSGGTPGPNCDGVFTLDMNAFARGVWEPPGGQTPTTPAAFLLIPGQRVNCQWWGRDSVSTGSFMSDALEYVICP